jgi:hypothetical protein
VRGRGIGVRDDLRPGGAARGEFRQALLVERRDRGLVPGAELLYGWPVSKTSRVT